MDMPSLSYGIDDAGVATVRFKRLSDSFAGDPPGEIHDEVGRVIHELAAHDDLRAVILTGANDGEFLAPPDRDHYNAGTSNARLRDPYTTWIRYRGVVRAMRGIADLEVPVIARVNGDAVSFGQSLMFVCDFVVAREDAHISDMHLSRGSALRSSDGAVIGPEVSMVPGDGALPIVPLLLAPALAKEYLIFGRTFTAGELANMGVINYAVPLADLDAKTAELVEGILDRPRDIVAWTKRLANRNIMRALDEGLDASIGFQMLRIAQDYGVEGRN
ncbi:enoyl-CoA hydratase/isomerase family protein [Rhodococcus erythropolis]